MQMRKLAAAAALALAAMATASYAAKDVVVAVATDFQTLDPWNCGNTVSQAVSKSFCEGLFNFDKDMNVKPMLATSYKVSADGLTYDIMLQKGVKFHDGTPFNAAAVKYNFDRVTNPDNHLRRYVLYQNIAKTEAIADDHVRFTLKQPFSAFINQLAHPSGGILSPAAIEKWGKDIGLHPVGTGPFKFVEWKRHEHMLVVKNPNYWKKGYPKVDSIKWTPVTDNGTRANMMQTGEAHIAYPMAYEQVQRVMDKGKIKIVVAPSIVGRYIALNVAAKPFDDVRVRQAVNYAVNKKALAKVAFGGYADPMGGAVPDRVQYSAKLQPYPYNPAKAKQLLKEAGYPNGFTTSLMSLYNNSTSAKVCQTIQQQLAQVGIKMTIRLLEHGQAADIAHVGKDKTALRMFYAGWSTSTGETDWQLRPLLTEAVCPPKGSNYSFYVNAKVEDGIKKALLTSDPKEKSRIYGEVQKQLYDDCPWLYLVTEKLVSAQQPNVSGFYVIPDANFNFEELDLK